MFKIILPLSVKQSKVKNFILNLNNYRNSHFQTLNKAKITYKAALIEQLSLLPTIKEKVHIHYIVFPKTKRIFDMDNVVSVHKKFFQDALVETGVLDEDNFNYIPTGSESYGSIDKEYSRLEAYIIPHSCKEYKRFIDFSDLLNKCDIK